MRVRSLALIALALLLAGPASAQLSRNYPARGKALEALQPAADYSGLTAQRPRSVAIMRARAHGYVPSPELNAYLKSVLTRLLTDVALPASFTPDVRVLAAPDFNALCTPDGTIVVSMGLLGQIQSEDELAFIMAHEVSHAILRHHGSDWFTKTQYYAIMNVSSLNEMATQVQAATAGTGIPGSNINLGNVQRGLDIASKIYALSENVIAPQFQQGQEDEADALAIDLMIKAGYSPAGAGAALERLAAARVPAFRTSIRSRCWMSAFWRSMRRRRRWRAM
jgi:predicted Zn-dependent protease